MTTYHVAPALVMTYKSEHYELHADGKVYLNIYKKGEPGGRKTQRRVKNRETVETIYELGRAYLRREAERKAAEDARIAAEQERNRLVQPATPAQVAAIVGAMPRG